MNTNYKYSIPHIKAAYRKQKKYLPSNKYIVLYRAIKECIVSIQLPHNWLLPSTRILAEELNLSRTTVNKSYELLKLEKLIVAKVGSGNRVNFNMDDKKSNPIKDKLKDGYPQISERGKYYSENIKLLNRMPNEHLAFRPGLPPVDAFPINQWKKLLNTYWRHVKSSSLNYSISTGLTELKKSVSNYLNVSRNIKCNYEQIVIVSGSLQSLYLISNALINKGDSVVLENPLFPNVHSVFKSAQANLHPVYLDAEGIDLAAIKKIKTKPKLIHVTPSNHYPLGIKMSLQRRQGLLNWASENKALIIENDYENEIANVSERLPSIFSLDTEDRTIYMGTFNRLLHPSIRLGYMIVPEYLKTTVQALLEHSHRFVSPSIQVVMNQFIEKNYLYKHIENSIEIARQRYYLFVQEFKKISRNTYIDEKPFSSYHLLAYFRNSVSVNEERELIKNLEEENITAFSLSKCYIGKPQKKGLILGYSSVRPSVLKRKIDKMKGVV